MQPTSRAAPLPARNVFWIRFFYFTYCAALAAMGPYLALFFKSRGMAGWRLGLLTGLPPFVALLAGPLWGMLADATRLHRAILMSALGVTIVTVASLSGAHGFAALLGCVLLYSVFACTIAPLVDSTTLQILGERRGDYSRHRAWGTLGYMLVSPLVAWLFASAGFRICFGFYGIAIALAAAGALKLPRVAAGPRARIWHGMRTVAREPVWAVFLTISLLCGIAYSVTSNYIFIYMDELGISPQFKGWAQVANTLSELPVMLLGAHLLRRAGARRLLDLALVCFALRCIACSRLHTGWGILALQFSHALTFAILWVGGTGRAHELAPPGMAATAQGLFAGISTGLGTGIGALLGGMLVSAYGARAMYAATGWALLALAAILLPLTRHIRVPRWPTRA